MKLYYTIHLYIINAKGSFDPKEKRRFVFFRASHSDTNIYMVHFLREMAAAHTALGHPAARATELLETAANVSAAVNEHLWSKNDGTNDERETLTAHQ